jgi:cytochrome c6
MSEKLLIVGIGTLTAILLGICVPVYGQQPGAATFKAKCAMCHGADGAGKTGMGIKLKIPDLRAPQIHKQLVADLAQTIAKGKNKMPAFAEKLASDEITQVATYVHELK